jgi:predicted transcriptional regulator
MIDIERSSNTHLVLKYLKMKNSRPSTKKDIYTFNPNRFDSLYAVRDYLNHLIDYGFAICKNKQYTITPQGKEALCFIVAQQPVERYNDKSSII